MKLNKTTKDYLSNKSSGYLAKDQEFESLDKYLRLDLGENLLGSAGFMGEFKTIKEDTLAFYTDPSNTKIKKIISSLYDISTKNVLISNSSDQIIDFLPRMLIKPGNKNLMVIPTFFRFIESSQKMGGKNIYVNLLRENGYKPDTDIINKICKISRDNVDITWICNPNNPTGEIYELDDIEKILKSSQGLVVVDEAFFELYDPSNKLSAIKLINKYENLLVIRTLSKGYGLAGLRFAYAIGHKKTISIIENYQDTLLMTSGLVVKLAEFALTNQKFIKETAAQTKKIKKVLFDEIKLLNNIEIGADTKTNIYLLRHKNKNLHKELLRKNILTADFSSALGLEGQNFIRVTVADKDKNIQLLNALKEIC